VKDKVKKRLMILGTILIASNSLGEEVKKQGEQNIIITEGGSEADKLLDAVYIDIPESGKKWEFNSRFNTIQRQKNRITGNGVKWGLPDDNWEDGDIYTFVNSLSYAFTDKTSVEFSFNYEYEDEQQIGFLKNPLPEGKYSYNTKDKDHLNSRQYTVTINHDLGRTKLFGKNFKNDIYFGYKYWETDSFGREGERYRIPTKPTSKPSPPMDLTLKQKNISWSNKEHHRLFLGTRTSSKLNDNLNFVLTTQYRYIKDRFAVPITSGQKAGEIKKFSYQHRFYLTPAFNFKLGENTTFKFKNGLQVREYVAYTDSKNERSPLNRGYWEPEYTLEHKIKLLSNITLTLPLKWWAEFHLWNTNNPSGWADEAEFNFLPELSKTFKLNKNMKLKTNLSGGYVYGYNSNASPKDAAYKGWETRFGMNFTYEF